MKRQNQLNELKGVGGDLLTQFPRRTGMEWMQGLVNVRKAPGGLCEVLKPQVDYFHSKLTLNEMIYLDRELLSVCPLLNAMHESP